jgi:hypothetical protein
MKNTSYKKIIGIDIGIILVLLITLGFIDNQMQLGQFHGLVFYLWSLYGVGLFIIINSIVAITLYLRDKKEKFNPILYTGFIVGGSTILLLFASTWFIQK